jgi:hypothetical protein
MGKILYRALILCLHGNAGTVLIINTINTNIARALAIP